MPGPPSLLEKDPALADRFLELIKDGVPRAYAALGCGFSYATLYGWVRKGLAPDAPEPYASFARRLYEVEVALMRSWLRQLSGRELARVETGEDGEGGWSATVDRRALEWLLPRRFPKAFGESAPYDREPIEDIEKELERSEQQAAQLEAGGDGGQLDEDRWSVVEDWFLAPTPRLLEIARKTGLAARALAPEDGAAVDSDEDDGKDED